MAGFTFLLDTNILLAALIDPDSLPAPVRQELRDPANTVLFSAVSIWEIAIKYSLGREDFDFRPDDIRILAEQTGFRELPLFGRHCDGVADLPWHHRDPFDRLLIAQAKSLPAYLLTRNSALVMPAPRHCVLLVPTLQRGNALRPLQRPVIRFLLGICRMRRDAGASGLATTLERVGCGEERTAPRAPGAVRKLTAPYAYWLPVIT